MDEDRYDPKTIEAKWQRVWEDARAFYVDEPGARDAARTTRTGTSSRCCRTRPATASTWATSSTTRWATSSTHVRRRSGWRGPAPDGLGRVRPAGRERGDPRGRPPARDHRAQHRHDPRADEAARLGDRLGPRGLVARPGVLPLDAVAVPEVLRGGARVPEGGAGQLVPERPDGDRERVHRRRPLRALRRARRAAEHDAVVLQDDRVRRRAARVRPAARRRVAGADEDDPAQLDRPLRGRRDPLPRRRPRPGHPGLHDARRHAVRRDVLRRRARAPVRRGARERGGAGVRAPRRRAPLARTAPPRRRRPASSPATTRRTRSTASGSRSGSPTTS